MYDEAGNLSRRDALKIGITVATGLATESAPKFVRDITSRLDLDRKTAFTEISPIFDIRSHLLSSTKISENTAIVSGEVNEPIFDLYFPDIKNKKVKFGIALSNSPSTSVSQEQITDLAIAVQKMLGQRAEVIASDLNIKILTENVDLPSKAFEAGDKFRFQSALTVGLTGGGCKCDWVSGNTSRGYASSGRI